MLANPLLRRASPYLFLAVLPALVHLPGLAGGVRVAAWSQSATPDPALALRLALMAISGLAAYALIRRLQTGVWAALTAASLFALNGTFAWFSGGPALPIAALPLLLLGVEQARARALPWALVLGTGGLLLSLRETAIPPYAALTLVWAACRLGTTPRPWLLALGGTALGLLPALPVLAALWHPILPAPPPGIRGLATASSFLPADATLMLFPYVFGDPTAPAAVTGREAAIWAHGGGYLDLTWTLLAMSALRGGAGLPLLRRALGVFLLVSLVCAAGLAPMFANPADVLVCWCITAATLAGLTLDDWRRGITPRFRRAMLFLSPVLPCVIAPPYFNILLAMRERRPGIVFPGVITGLSISIVVQLAVVIFLSALLRHSPTRVRVFAVSALLAGNTLGLFLTPMFDGVK